MNLNFYQPDNNSYLESLRNSLTEQINKLDQLKNITLNQKQQHQPQAVGNTNQPQRYYLDCGIKEDWDEFLKINYGINEKKIFEDYRLFLQAKAELSKDADKEKLEAMKNKLKPKENTINVSNNTNANVPNTNSIDKQAMEHYSKEVQG